MSTPRFVVAAAVPTDAPLLGIPVFDDLTTPAGAGATVDAGFLAQRRFEGKPGQAQALMADDGTTVVAVGVGKAGSVDAAALRKAGAALARQAGRTATIATTLMAALAEPDLASAVVEGIGLGAYRYERAPARKTKDPVVENVTVVNASADAVARGQVAVDATWRARDWVNRPARELTPRIFAEAVEKAARTSRARSRIHVDVWDETKIESARLGALLGVAAGAEEPPRLIRISYKSKAAKQTVAFVGKGITFDSGGLSLKTGAGMMTMKCDMGGAAAVAAAVMAVAEQDLPINVTGWIAATENMPSGTAIHPGDVVTARNGKTIEVLNTDAEGRLVLADALSLAVEEGPDAVVDIATLTGGQRIALGDSVAAVMGSNGQLVKKIIEAGAKAGEPVWELPLYADYRKQLDSEVADLKNVTSGTNASSIMAALFLQEFAGDQPWAHLDIAGPAWAESEDGMNTKGGTGWGARTLIELARGWS